MGIIETFNKYMQTEIPDWKTKWLTEDFSSQDQMVMEKIAEDLRKLQENARRRGTT